MEQQISTTTASAPLSSIPLDLLGLGRKRLEALFEAQSKLVDTLPALSREWMSCAQAERELTSDLLAKLAAARSLPESAKAYQEWLSRRIDIFADETRMLFADTQKLVDVGARLLAVDAAGNGAATAAQGHANEVH
jgi:hypothetical protein